MGHYVKQRGKKPYLKKREWIALGAALGALALAVAGYFIVQAILDDSLPMKDGKVVTDVANPIVVNEGTAARPKYYLYGSYDFSVLDAEVVVEDVNGDGNATSVYLYPRDGAYAYGYVYGQGTDARATAENVQKNISPVLKNGDVDDLQDYAHAGRTGSFYWYTNWNDKVDESGQTLTDADGNALREYQQTFSCYMPTARGCLIVRVTHKGTDESAYVDEATGRAEIGAILDGLKIE